MAWLRDLWSVLVSFGGVPVNQRVAMDFEGAGVTVADDPSKQRTVITIGGASSPAVPVVGSELDLGLAFDFTPALRLGTGTPFLTTDATPTTLLSLPISPGATVALHAVIQARLTTPTQLIPYLLTLAVQVYRNGSATPAISFGDVMLLETSIIVQPFATLGTTAPGFPTITVTGAADNGSGLVRLAVNDTSAIFTGGTFGVAGLVHTTEANGTWTGTVVDGTHVDLQGSTFVHAYVGGGGSVTPLGCAGVALSGNNLTLRAVGIVPAAWLQSQAVVGGDLRWDATANRTYVCVQAGTTSNAGTGPGTTGNGITDGTAKWDFAYAGRVTSILWTAIEFRAATT